ncbi:hypothetical protein [Pseudoflavonifractor phocaeensis]|uniref:hypothetical protein n=1 Tax=Pseudoflavonifractor phocaeensis TaxID=1870988 RepID=UPI001FAEAF27|nr:hypothetical protein [Pseudoflavonifractor phocaeensis]
MAEERHEKHHHAYFYDEKEFYPDSKMKQWLSDHADIVVKEERLVILGERTGFSQKTAPVNFKLKRTDGENLLFYGFEEVDFNNLCMTMVTNVLANPNAKLLINCADPDLFNVLAIEEWYDPDFLSIARPMTDVSEWVDTLLDMIESRKEMDPSEYGPIYFMPLRWDKQLGICVDENYRLVDKWKSVLTSGPAVDVHVLWGVQLYIASCAVINRVADRIGARHLYTGNLENRYEVAEFCMAIVDEMFRGRTMCTISELLKSA